MFKVDQAQQTKVLKATVNNCIWLTSIMGLQDNRDHVNQLEGARNGSADGPLSMFDSIYLEIQIQSNDPGLTFVEPERVSYLSTYIDLDPNDPDRIKVTLDYKWIKKMCTDRISNYNKGLTK